jgi:glycosyltransferase involved in cell wall biosynthesis
MGSTTPTRGLKLKLAIFIDQIFWYDGEHYSTDEAFVKFVQSFCPYVEKVIFCGRLAPERKTERYILDGTKFEFYALPFYSDLYALSRHGFSITKRVYSALTDELKHWDLVWLCIPHPLALIFVYLCKKYKKPFFMLVRQNLVEQMRHRTRGMKRTLSLVIVHLLEYWFQGLAARYVTFCKGREMYMKYKKRTTAPVFETAYSLMSREEIQRFRAQKKHQDEHVIKILCVGRLDPEKGHGYLIEALVALRGSLAEKLELHIVGSGRMQASLENHATALNVKESVCFHGYVKHGEALFDLYHAATYFVLPSLTGEGIPLVLFEAMAFGVPVVATKVGGIPYLFRSGEDCLLVESHKGEQIAQAVTALYKDRALRGKIIEGGYATVVRHTLEEERDRMLSVLRDHHIWPDCEELRNRVVPQ